jgi:hypothetical protein
LDAGLSSRSRPYCLRGGDLDLAARRTERVVGKHHHGLVAEGEVSACLELSVAVSEVELLHELRNHRPIVLEQRRFGQAHGAREASEYLLVRQALAWK